MGSAETGFTRKACELSHMKARIISEISMERDVERERAVVGRRRMVVTW